MGKKALGQDTWEASKRKRKMRWVDSYPGEWTHKQFLVLESYTKETSHPLGEPLGQIEGLDKLTLYSWGAHGCWFGNCQGWELCTSCHLLMLPSPSWTNILTLLTLHQSLAWDLGRPHSQKRLEWATQRWPRDLRSIPGEAVVATVGAKSNSTTELDQISGGNTVQAPVTNTLQSPLPAKCTLPHHCLTLGLGPGRSLNLGTQEQPRSLGCDPGGAAAASLGTCSNSAPEAAQNFDTSATTSVPVTTSPKPWPQYSKCAGPAHSTP